MCYELNLMIRLYNRLKLILKTCRPHSVQWVAKRNGDDTVSLWDCGGELQQEASGWPPSVTGVDGGFRVWILFQSYIDIQYINGIVEVYLGKCKLYVDCLTKGTQALSGMVALY